MEENYNIFEAVYPSIEADNKRQSRGYETLVRNNMDTAEFMGEEPDSDAGVVDRAIKSNELNSFVKDTVDFIASIPADTLIGITRAGANATQKGIQLGRFIADEAGIDYAVDDLTAIDDKINKFKEGLNKYQEDSPFITRLMGYAAQEGSAVYPLYRKFKQMGMPRSYAMLLSFGIGGTLSLGPEDQLTLDSKTAKYFKDVFKVEEGSPGEDIFNMGWSALENTFIGGAFDQVIEGLRYGKKIIKGAKIDQTAIAGAGGAATGAAVEKAIEQPEQPQQPMLNDEQGNFLDEKKKFGQVQTDYPPDNQIAGGTGVAKQIFKSMLEEGAKKLPNKGSGAQFLGQLKNTQGIKEAELKWTGLDDYLKKNKTVTKEDVQSFLNENKIEIEEVKYPRLIEDRPMQVATMTADDMRTRFNLTDNQAAMAEKYLIDYDEAMANVGGERRDSFSGTYQRGGRDEDGILEYDQEYTSDTLSYRSLSYTFRSKDINFESYEKNDFIEKYSEGAYEVDITNFNQKDIEKLDDFYKGAGYERWSPDYGLSREEFDEFQNFINASNMQITEVNITKLNANELGKFYDENKIRIAQEEFQDIVGVSIDSTSQRGPGTMFASYTLPGGTDYTEIVLKLNKDIPVMQNRPLSEKVNLDKAGDYDAMGRINESPHFGQPKEIAHVRFKTRYTNKGSERFAEEKVLAIDEMQSDLLQQVKDMNKGIAREGERNAADFLGRGQDGSFVNVTEEEAKKFARENYNEGVITDFPFKNNWYELVMKRLIRYGADNDFDAIAVPRGKVAQNRYGQKGDFINKIEIKGVSYDNLDADFDVNFLSKDGEVLNSNRVVTQEQLKNILKDYKVKAGDLDSLDEFISSGKTSDGKNNLEFEVGDKKKYVGKGRGKIELYDQAIPSMMKKYAKKFNTKVTTQTIDDNEYVVFQLTDDLKKTAQEDGQALFNYFGIGTAGAAASQGVLDSQGNNTISQSTNN